MADNINAFVPGGQFRIDGAVEGPLIGLKFVAKDLFDVAGHVTGGGNPDWAANRPIPKNHAWAVQRLLDAGANLIGKTITDEVSLGILGENAFFGTPVNSAAPERVPGGSSSGTAAAVAAGLADTGLGSDTGGSVRVPASFCGLYGIRPTHGRLNLSGMMAQAPSSDTTGWFARDAETFRKVSTVMLDEDFSGDKVPKIERLVIAVDTFGFADPNVSKALQPMLKRLGTLADEIVEEVMAPPGLSVWGRAQRCLQPAEAWTTFRDWLERSNPRLAFNVARGLVMGANMPDTELQWAALMRREARARLDYLLPPGTILAMPTTPFSAPKKGLPLPDQNRIRELILCLCAHGGLAGLPQINIPGASIEGAPVGLSLLAGRDQDAHLISIAEKLSKVT